MKATNLLKDQHKEVERIFDRIAETNNGDKKIELFEVLANHLVAHDDIERVIFYPACEREMGMTNLLSESIEEHGILAFSLYRAYQALGEDDFDYKIKVLEDVVNRHVKEEEDELFPKVEKAFTEEVLRDLGRQMQPRFERDICGGFRGLLENSLRQVLSGADVIKLASNGAKKNSSKQEVSVLRVR